jgi:site-specific recombinase XerD
MGPGEPGFHEHYYAARAGRTLETTKPKTVKTGTLDALCDRYLAALEERIEAGQASSLTLKGHRSLLRQACDVLDPDGDRMGSLDADLPEEAFVHIQDSFGSRTGSADNAIKALRAAYRWGAKRGFPKGSAVFDVERVHQNRGGATAWTAEDVTAFMKRHQPGSMARLWLWLSLNALPRIGDVPTLGRDHMVEREGRSWLSYQPGKRGSAPVEVPALTGFLDELARHPVTPTFMTTEAGASFASSEAMRNRIQDWTKQAGLPAGRTQHGFRKHAAELLAAAGATQYELMSVMSHTQAKTSEIYTKRVERAGLSARAIERIDAMRIGGVDHDTSRVVHRGENI